MSIKQWILYISIWPTLKHSPNLLIYNPIFKSWDAVYNVNKNRIEERTKTTHEMLKRNVIAVIFNLMPATCIKKSEQQQQQNGKLCNDKNTPGKHLG